VTNLGATTIGIGHKSGMSFAITLIYSFYWNFESARRFQHEPKFSSVIKQPF
jgi:hypothetical protein